MCEANPRKWDAGVSVALELAVPQYLPLTGVLVRCACGPGVRLLPPALVMLLGLSLSALFIPASC